MTFDQKIENLKTFLIEIVRPSVGEYIRMHNPVHFDEWQHNCCKQLSIVVNALLKEILLDTESGYIQVESWEGLFLDVVYGRQTKYNHCWVYCSHPDPSKNLLIDVARNHKENLVILTPENAFPRSHPDYARMIELDRRPLNVLDHLKEKEYFTGKFGKTFMRDLKKYMKMQILLSASKPKQVENLILV